MCPHFVRKCDAPFSRNVLLRRMCGLCLLRKVHTFRVATHLNTLGQAYHIDFQLC